MQTVAAVQGSTRAAAVQRLITRGTAAAAVEGEGGAHGSSRRICLISAMQPTAGERCGRRSNLDGPITTA